MILLSIRARWYSLELLARREVGLRKIFPRRILVRWWCIGDARNLISVEGNFQIISRIICHSSNRSRYFRKEQMNREAHNAHVQIHWGGKKKRTRDEFEIGNPRQQNKETNSILKRQYNPRLVFSKSSSNCGDDGDAVFGAVSPCSARAFAVQWREEWRPKAVALYYSYHEIRSPRERPCRRQFWYFSPLRLSIRCKYRRAFVEHVRVLLSRSPVSISVDRVWAKSSNQIADPSVFPRERWEFSNSTDVHAITNRWWHFETTLD